MERRALCTLPWNPFVANLLDAYVDPRNTYLLLELAPRGSIHDHIRVASGPMSALTSKFYFANIVLGLEFLHSQGLVHKDIKNENILIGADGYAMIADFGLSQYVNEGTWDRMGTYYFISPEIIEGDSDQYSAEAKYASDWWGAACCLFEMMTSTVVSFHSLLARKRVLIYL